MKSLFRAIMFCVFAVLGEAQISGNDYIIRCTNGTQWAEMCRTAAQ